MAINSTSTKILVTGANGLIGLRTVLHFLKRGYNLCATVRTKEQGEKVRQTVTKHTDTEKLEFTYADLTRDEGCCGLQLCLASRVSLSHRSAEGGK